MAPEIARDLTTSTESFYQWQMLAPYFSLVSKNNNEVQHYNLDDHIILPFMWEDIADEPAAHGGTADIKRVKTHRAHQNFCTFDDENRSLPSYETQDPTDPRSYGRQGDLKPENILWFSPGQHTSDNFGTFVISDFGLTMLHDNLRRLSTYRPPEYDVLKEASQKYHIRSLGCVLLELLIWYLLGWKGVEDFQTDRIMEDNSRIAEDVFSNFIEEDSSQKCFQLKRSVAIASYT
ncbi:hypothetical protein BDZ45DRAFT_777701 [Acephala macrosclerotiorum]|nr:hypothetical protein BDZ45DRAFT_777701 [Acephala macrosclerotiorum]